MKPEFTKLRSPIEIPSVQELAKEKLTTVPPRYVRSDQDNPIISDTSSLRQVPIIDLQSLLSGDSIALELEKLHHACKEWGFFQLINHGVSSSLVDKVKLGIQEFFNLPLEEKKKFGQKPGDMEGFGQHFVVSEEQKLDWADLFYMTTIPTHLRKPHLFPKLSLSFRDSIEAYSTELQNLAMKVLNLMVKALEMEADDMKVLFEEGTQCMRMNYYPPCPQPEQVIGLTPHSDASGLTILLQVNDQLEGLQIKKDGIWIPVIPLPNALVVNIGDTLEIVTNGIYRSVEHRAIVNSEKQRLSIATFISPKSDAELAPAPSIITRTPALFKRIAFEDYCKGYFSRKLAGKSYLDMIRIENEDGQNN